MHSGMVNGILLARVPRPYAEDLVQDVFLFAFQKLNTLREPAAFAGWLATIARHRAADYFRREPRAERLPEDLAACDSSDEECAWVLGQIRALPEAYRETLLLRLVEGMSGPEIAARTGLTPDSVRVNLHRGMKQLREKLEREPRR